MATKPNRLDQVTKLLRDQLKDIEQEQRELQRAKDRVLKALGLFVKDPTGPKAITGRGGYTRPDLGPKRKDSHVIVSQAIKAAFAPGHVFHRRQVYDLPMSEPLRFGQMAGAVDTLYHMGVLKRADKKGWYYHGDKTEDKNGNGS